MPRLKTEIIEVSPEFGGMTTLLGSSDRQILDWKGQKLYCHLQMLAHDFLSRLSLGPK